MKNNNFSGEILGVIKNKKISPKPKWQFLVKNYFIWLLGVFALILGALSFSVIIYLVRFSDWGVYSQLSDSLFDFIILTLPYFWLVFLVIFIFIIYYNIKHTKRGYRYPLLLMAIISISASLILGVVFFNIGWGQEIDKVLGERAPLYKQVINPQIDFWSQPEQGRLAGVIISKKDQDNFTILDVKNNEWIISRADNDNYSHRFPLKIEIEEGSTIRLLGDMTSPHNFIAKLILPMRSGHSYMMRLNRHSMLMNNRRHQRFFNNYREKSE